MKNCSECKKQLLAELSSVPERWRGQIADVLCAHLEDNKINCPGDFEETLTSLSNFSTDGSLVCIKYTDENSVTFTRCFDFKYIINASLDELDPKCLTSKNSWLGLTHSERMQLFIDKVCVDCQEGTTSTTTTTTQPTTTTTTTQPTTTTTTSTSTSTTTSSTTTTTTQARVCKAYSMTNFTAAYAPYQYTNCLGGASNVIQQSLSPGGTITFCAFEGSVISGVNTLTLIANCNETTTTTSSTTTSTTIGCEGLTVFNPDSEDVMINYVDCATRELTYHLIGSNVGVQICIQTGTLAAPQGVSIISNGNCNATSTTTTTTICPSVNNIIWEFV